MRARALVLAALLAAGGVAAQTGGEAEVEMSRISGDPQRPRRHFRLRRAQDLDPARARDLYRIVSDAMARGYARSGLAAARAYRGWTRFNTAPYLSSTHGNHYLNNYVNPAGAAYGRYEEGGRLPVGSVIAKDSLSVTASGEILLGPLFLMEKMAPGFNHVSGDWRYTMVLPDGQVMGTTRGEGTERVHYCIACHLAVEAQDHLYFPPPEARR